MEFQWFPGHMTKTKNLILENRDKVDVFLELLDARAPFSCRNPLLAELIARRPRVVILNKIDLADPNVTALWKKHFEAQAETTVVPVSSKERKNLVAITTACEELCRDKQWFGNRPIHGMIVGIPNVGKSTLINALSGSHKVGVAPKPGHTRGIQKIKVNERFELLDTPGILWHKFEDMRVGQRLAMLGAIKDDVYDFVGLTLDTINYLLTEYPERLNDHYKLNPDSRDAAQTLEAIGRRRGHLVKGGTIDLERSCQLIMSDLRCGELGRFSLERP